METSSYVTDFVLRGLVGCAQVGEGVFARIDATRVTLTGFDLGTQIVLALAGEKHPGGPVPPSMPPLRTVVALYPQAILSGGGFAERFGAVLLPVLTLTGTEDTDPYGLVNSPHTRQAPFACMAPGDKFLRVVGGAHSPIHGRRHGGRHGQSQSLWWWYSTPSPEKTTTA